VLLEGVLDVTEQSAVESAQWVPGSHLARLRLEFQRFCELNPPPAVRTWPDANHPGRRAAEARQSGNAIARRGVGRRTATTTPVDHKVYAGGLPPPTAAHLVHRRRPENVLVGGFTQVSADAFQVEVLSPPPGHYFRRRSSRLRSMGELVEATRQFGTLLAHTARRVPLGMQFVVRSLEVELTRPVSRDEPVAILTRSLPPSGSRKGTIAFAVNVGDENVGSAKVLSSVLSADAYERIRAGRG